MYLCIPRFIHLFVRFCKIVRHHLEKAVFASLNSLKRYVLVCNLLFLTRYWLSVFCFYHKVITTFISESLYIDNCLEMFVLFILFVCFYKISVLGKDMSEVKNLKKKKLSSMTASLIISITHWKIKTVMAVVGLGWGRGTCVTWGWSLFTPAGIRWQVLPLTGRGSFHGFHPVTCGHALACHHHSIEKVSYTCTLLMPEVTDRYSMNLLKGYKILNSIKSLGGCC